MQNEAGEINEIAETNAAKRRRLEQATVSGMHSGAKCKRIVWTGSIELLVLPAHELIERKLYKLNEINWNTSKNRKEYKKFI